MALIKLNPKSSLNKAFLKVKPNRIEIEKFKNNLISLLDTTNDTESEEFHKNLVSDFLKKSYYDPSYFINTKGRNDLVIHNGKDAKNTVGVIVEAKKPTNKAEMLKQDNINVKAFQELVLYYLRERITHKNIEVKWLVATNINEWFIFDASVFEKNFAQNKSLVAKFNDFEAGRLPGTNTDFFYKEVAQPAIAAITTDIEFTYFDIRDYEKPLRNADKKDDNKLIALYKLLSPEHLLKLPLINDSNSLDKKFYSELLHIIGLTETKEGSKKFIQRKNVGERDSGSLLENAIDQIDSLDKLSRLDSPNKFGANKEERLFNLGLELVITWVNRILFLKLLEAQLLSYHKGDKLYSFLKHSRISNFDDLNSLFFQVLARKNIDRNEDAKKLFSKVPYLNSSLFEPTEIEHTTLLISNLRDEKKIPIITSTVLKDENGKKRTGELSTLEYLFEFLDAYDFASEGSEEIQEENKALINASVLGLIFEKINGYKDGSFFTPGFVTMYMSRETIRKAVVQKFNDVKKWECESFDELYDRIDDRKEANQIINSIKICDPAVGSGHFLVSALNEIIAIKSDLKVLLDRDGKRLKEYQVEVVNDELIITDEDGEFFEYKPTNNESQRIQEALFHEKQTIIESCLFGVDINPNSVKICRLRLWIELLKNAYYKNSQELETLPNIDINIKCGNSLISRFGLDSDLKEALKKSKLTISKYKSAVDTYRNAVSKEQKREMELLIEEIKNNFRVEIYGNDPKIKRLEKLKNEFSYISGQSSLFEETAKEKKARKQKLEELQNSITKMNFEIEEIKSNKIYENAFEWRFEFPEVLNENGDYVGFDVAVGNPPYIRVQELDSKSVDYYKLNYKVAYKRVDISIIFIEIISKILKQNGIASLITSNQFLTTEYGSQIRRFLKNEFSVTDIVDFGDLPIFEEALTYVSIFDFKNTKPTDFRYVKIHSMEEAKLTDLYIKEIIKLDNLSEDNWILKNDVEIELLKKLNIHTTLNTFGKSWAGLFTGLDDVLMFSEEEIKKMNFEQELILPVARANDCSKYYLKQPTKYVIYPYKVEENKTVLLTEKELSTQYPNVYTYLLLNKDKLAERMDSRKKLNDSKSWFKLTRFGQKEVFNKTKILSPGEVKEHKFCIDYTQSGFSCARVFAITIEDIELDIKYVLALLNSKLIRYFIQSNASLKAGGYFSYSSGILNKIPIIKADINIQNQFKIHVEEIENLINQGKDSSEIDEKVDALVYKLYDISDQEISIIESSFK